MFDRLTSSYCHRTVERLFRLLILHWCQLTPGCSGHLTRTQLGISFGQDRGQADLKDIRGVAWSKNCLCTVLKWRYATAASSVLSKRNTTARIAGSAGSKKKRPTYGDLLALLQPPFATSTES